MNVKIYHNPRCRKSREGLALLKSSGIGFEVVEYLKKGLSPEDIKEILLKLHVSPKDLVRKNEVLYKTELKNLELNDDEWINILSENPILLRRPIVILKHKGVIGDPAENIEKLLKTLN